MIPRTVQRSIGLHSYKQRVTSRQISSSIVTYLRNRTRVGKELTDDELRAFQRQKEARKGNDDDFYYETRPSSDSSRFTQDPAQFRTVFEEPPNTNGLITKEDPICDLLKEPTLVIERQMEFMNMFLGFEQANKYRIMNSLGEQVGYMEEKDYGFLKMLGRQFFRLHRPFELDVFNNYGDHILTIKRPFSFINSHIKALLPGVDPQGLLVYEIIGESVQSWHLWRRRYNLFKLEDDATENFDQFGAVDAPFLSFDFPVKNAEGSVVGSVDRNWVGLGRELFTDTGIYIIRMDPASFAGMGDRYPSVSGPLTLDQRAVLLATAVSIDFDYFSRHSRAGGGMFFFGDPE